MSNYISDYSGSQINNVIGLFHGKGLDQVTGLVQRNADGSFSQGSGGGGSDDVFVATPDVTTFAQLREAINRNKQIIVNTDDGLATVVFAYSYSNDYCYLNTTRVSAYESDGYIYRISSANTWTRTFVPGQEKLVSGTNIKTINNDSILGSGNITIGGEDNVQSDWNQTNTSADDYIKNKPTVPDVFVVTPNVTTYNELLAAIQAGKYLCTHVYDDYENTLSWIQFAEKYGDNIYLRYFTNNTRLVYKVTSSNVWSIDSNYIILTENSTLSASKLSGAIPASVTATTQSSGDNSTKIATTAYVDGAISNLPEPMIFKGSLGTGGTITTLPTAASTNKGFTYKVITDGTYASQAAKVGDTFISDGIAWVLIPSGDEPSGTVTSVATGVGLTGGPVTSSGTIKANLVSETSQGTIGTTDKLYAVGVDSTGNLCVSVPWTGTVTSVATGSGLSGGPITSSGTISLATAFGDTVNPYGSKTANYVLAAPNGAAGVPTFRALVVEDLPSSLLQKTQLITDNFTIDNITVTANGYSGAQTKDVSKDGYTPLMIQISLVNASSNGKNVTGCYCYTQTLSGNTVSCYIANRFNSDAKVQARIKVLYKAN